MANWIQVNILKRGFPAWNLWYSLFFSEESSSHADLSYADLSHADLSGTILRSADLSYANLSGTNLFDAKLSNASLIGANLSSANLKGANLRNANLSGANLSGADLSFADLYDASLKGTNLTNADLGGTNLTNADLSSAKLTDAKLSRADLSDAKLSDADLSGADLYGAHLFCADLIKANLIRAYLFCANLNGADLSSANLINANLAAVQALGTNFQNATLTGACIQNWNISSRTHLQEVICEYIFTQYADKSQFTNRIPHAPNKFFAPGDFAKLVQQSLDTISLIFRESLDWRSFAYSFEQLQVHYANEQIAIQNIENKGDGTVVVKLTVSPDADKGSIEQSFWRGFEMARKTIAVQYESRLEDKDKHINQLFNLLQQSQEKLGEVPKLMAENPKYDLRNSNFGGGFAAEKGIQTGGTFNDFSQNIQVEPQSQQPESIDSEQP